MKISKQNQEIIIDGSHSKILIPKNGFAMIIDKTVTDGPLGEIKCIQINNFTATAKPKGVINTLKLMWELYKYIS